MTSKAHRIIGCISKLEMKRREDGQILGRPGQIIRLGQILDEQAESSESHGTTNQRTKPIPESSESHWDDELTDKPIPESSDWSKYCTRGKQRAGQEP
ncbi:hypothetical protein AVEN_197284-1 [Araneus ventricosus]|uniref:Uncharacterized protein n=1 Tax=Araneus ventricosus TaxID=182803 RepID=A0A4Y2B8B5_ARAVE|nr:hypothetical protein AVEN_197284-1 [Araneus ventricosus]